jgi:hypothetical protein
MSRARQPIGLALLICGCLGSLAAEADGVHIAAVGVQSSVSGTVNGQPFEQYSLDLRLSLPWAWSLPFGLSAAPEVELTGSYLRLQGDSAGAAFAGAVVSLTKKLMPQVSLFAEVGTGPTLISNHQFGTLDLGGPLQFTHHLSVGLRAANVVLALRFQHMSNAHIYAENPGADVRLIELDYRF